MTNDLSHKVIRFFKECYESDNRETNITNLFSKKVNVIYPLTDEESRLFLKNSILEIPNEKFNDIGNTLEKYKREKKLVFASHHIVLRLINSEGKAIRYCAPILLFNAELTEEQSNDTVSIKLTQYQWNLPVLRELVNDNTRLEELDNFFDKENPNQLYASKFINWLNQNDHGTEFKLHKGGGLEVLKKLSRSRAKNQASFIYCRMLAVVDRSANTRGILHELKRLGGALPTSNSLKQLLTGEQTKLKKLIPPDFDSLPGILSEAQQQILHNAATKRLSQVIGPPGTGKSYTIANIAIDRFLAGESVLVVSQNEHAINVIHKHLSSKLGISSKGVVRAGSSQYHKNLKKYVSNLLNNIRPTKVYIKSVYGINYLVNDDPDQLYEPSKELNRLKKKIAKLERSYILESESAVQSGLKLDAYLNLKSFPKLLARIGLFINDPSYSSPDLLFEVMDTLQGLYNQREQLVAELINVKYENRLNEILQDQDGRKTMVKFQSVLKAQNSSRQELMLEQTNYEDILKVLPIWLSSLEGLHKSLPLQKELFDVVIIDEATQCDIASCLPAIQRAKRLVVVGDPEQLRHISFLSRSKQDRIRAKHGLNNFDFDLNFRDESIIDMINHNLASINDVVMLDEHYRGLPKLIQFSNEKFYGNNLRIMTEKPSTRDVNPISIIQANGKHFKGVNQVEADCLINYLREIIQSQQELPNQYKLSIGILSFFRDQAELLQNKILELPTLQISDHQLRAGTPYAFQGEERDIMLISCCVDNESHWGSYQFLNWKNMFNVAITRAKSSQILFLSAKEDEMPRNNLLREYVASIKLQTPKNAQHKPIETNDFYMESLNEAFKKKNIKLVENFVLAGVPMDIVAVYKNNSVAVDLIGFPGKYEAAFPLQRYKIFDRAGFRIFPITLNEWKYKQEEIVERLYNELSHKVEEEEIHVTLQSLSDKWPLLLKFNADMAKEVRSVEMELFEIGAQKVLKQLGDLVESYHKLIITLMDKLEEGEHTFNRYKVAADSVLEISINTYKKIVAIQKSIPELNERDFNHPVTRLAREQKILVNDLIKNNDEVIASIQQMTINWSMINTKTANVDAESLFQELNSLNEQIKYYDK